MFVRCHNKLEILYICVFSLLIVSCDQPNTAINNEEIRIEMYPNNLPPPAKLSELVESVQILPLETSPNCMIGSVGKLYLGEEYIMLSTRSGSNDLMLFTTSGKFIRKIGHSGHGPGEYQNIRDISVLESEKEVYVTSGTKGEVIGYNFNGEFIRDIPGLKGAQESKVISSSQIVYASLVDFEVRIRDLSSQVTHDFIPINPETRSFNPRFNGDAHTGVFFSAIGRDTIWQVGLDSLWPVVTFDFGNGHLSGQEYLSSALMGKDFPRDRISISGRCINGPTYFHVVLMRQFESSTYDYSHCFIHKVSGQTWHFPENDESDDILFCTSYDFRGVTTEGEWVSVVGAYELIESLDKIRSNGSFKYDKDLIEQINALTTNDNPVLVMYTLKK